MRSSLFGLRTRLNRLARRVQQQSAESLKARVARMSDEELIAGAIELRMKVGEHEGREWLAQIDQLLASFGASSQGS